MPTKTVCFHCQSHSAFNAARRCYRCGSGKIAIVGSALRLPRKTASAAWKNLLNVFKVHNDFMPGFAQHNFRRRHLSKNGLPRKFKEQSHLQLLQKDVARSNI